MKNKKNGTSVKVIKRAAIVALIFDVLGICLLIWNFYKLNNDTLYVLSCLLIILGFGLVCTGIIFKKNG